ncbi:MAG: MATE family efflux transporter, partial [Muribaculaceae bacterium]|nr:MATE family efflux transporter [Muribaculaceae bacterium]
MSNLTTPLLGLVDVAVTGHIGAPVYIAAIAVGGAMFNMLYWLFNFLRMGSSGLTAQAWGAQDNLACRLVLYRALAIGAAIGTIMILLGQPLCKVVLQFMDSDGDTAALAARYFAICIWGAPAVMCSYALAGWMVGVQDSRAAMWMAIITNVVNVLISLSLVFGLGMRIEGVATGTTVAQWTGLAAGALIVWRKYRPVPPPLRLVFERGKLIAFFRINFFIFLRTCCLVAVTMWFTHAGAVQGNDILAANAILLQLFM